MVRSFDCVQFQEQSAIEKATRIKDVLLHTVCGASQILPVQRQLALLCEMQVLVSANSDL